MRWNSVMPAEGAIARFEAEGHVLNVRSSQSEPDSFDYELHRKVSNGSESLGVWHQQHAPTEAEPNPGELATALWQAEHRIAEHGED